VRVEDKDLPSIEHANDAIVRVEMAAIGGMDPHLYHGMALDTRAGMTFVHEFIGTVVAVHRHEVVGHVGVDDPADAVGSLTVLQ
jgi:threonine dehydrogenase-like Zn-dependent dehydrogenase